MSVTGIGTSDEAGGWEIDVVRRELRANGVTAPLGGRAFEIFEVLVGSAGELVTKNDLMERVWPGAIVEENTLQVHISAIRKALGPERGLLKTVSGRGYRLLGTWTRRQRCPSQTASFAAPRSQSPGRLSNVPGKITDLIGRTACLKHLSDLLSAYRVVTLTGPGGIGKTAVAFEAARSTLSKFSDGVWAVDLAPQSNPDLVASAIANGLGLKVGGEITVEAVVGAIGNRQLLLVLDNCEHVIDAAARLSEAVVRLCPRTCILATSREVLRIEGEQVYRVPPLDVPLQHERDADNILACGAVQLFAARMKALDSAFTPGEDILPVMAAICRRLDGIPLAIEFAAARAIVLGVPQTAARLNDRFALLSGGRRTALPRHRTLRATLDWSHDLLSELERRLLRRLAVFAGGFTLEAASALMSDSAEGPVVIDCLANLAAKSLVAVDVSAPTGRWRLLETIRAYAQAKLSESGEAEQMARLHAQFFRDLLASAILDAELLPIEDGMASFVRELDNVRSALDWSFSASGEAATGIVLTAAYVPVWLHLSLMVECREWGERAQVALEAEPTLSSRRRMQAYVALGMAEIGTKPEWTDLKSMNNALDLARSLGDADVQLRALWRLWSYEYYSGDWRTAQRLAEDFARVADRAGDIASARVGDRLIGTTLHYRGNQPSARHYLERMIASYVPQSDQRHAFWFHHDQRVVARAMLARVLCLQGAVDQAKAIAEESLAQACAKEHTLSLRYVLGWGAFPIALMTHDIAAAERFLRMFDSITATLLPFWKLMARGMQGTLLIRHGELTAGTALLMSALEAFRELGWMKCFPDMVGSLAEGLSGLGQPCEAIATIDEALARAEQGGGRWCQPELLRIKGELLLNANGALHHGVEGCFRSAMGLARKQGALLFELRAATSLVRAKSDRERPVAARECLAPIYARFTEGFKTADLRTAQALLEGISPVQSK